MGFVWNVILSFGDEQYWEEGEDAARDRCAVLNAINRWMPPDARLVDLTRPTFKEGCGYGMNAHVFGGGFKHFDVEGFIDTIKAQAWQDPANVQLFLKSNADYRFFSQPLFDGRRKRRQPQSLPRASRSR